MDVGYKDEFGYVYVMARDDDVINVAGHRLSTSALEDVILTHSDVVDAAVIGVPDPTVVEVEQLYSTTFSTLPIAIVLFSSLRVKRPICGNNLNLSRHMTPAHSILIIAT